MLTVDELPVIPPFSTLPEGELEGLARRAAGEIEVTKRMDGIERTIGWRAPGQIFGEVPLALAGVFLGSYRAAEPSRVVRVGAPQRYALAAAAEIAFVHQYLQQARA